MEGSAILDRAGGSPLYAAGAAAIWEKEIALLARVGEDYPYQFLQNFKKYNINTKGIQIIPGSLDLRSFRAYDKVRELLLQDKDAASIKKAAIAGGMRSLRAAGLAKALQGITTLEEVMRVTQEEV